MKACRPQLAEVLCGFLLSTAAAGADTVRGFVVNPISETPAGATEVAFVVIQDGQSSEILRKPTDDNGRFEFTGPFISPGLRFALVAFYKDVPHPTSALEVGGQKEIIIEVYETTGSDNDIRILTHNFFFDIESAMVDVAQFLELENLGERTYVGRGQVRDGQVTELSLPADAFNLSEGIIQAGTHRFYDGRPLTPGISQIAFSYQLDRPQLDEGYLHTALYPTDVINIFLKPSNLHLAGPFEDLGEATLHDIQYRHLQLRDLQPGQNILMPFPLPTSWRWALKWASLGACVLVGILALFLGRLQATTAPLAASPDRSALQNRRRKLIEKLAQLDDTAGIGDAARRQAQRDQLIDQALNVYVLLEERDGN